MPNFSKYEVVLVWYPFSDLSNAKVRPAVVVNAQHPSQDIIITPLTSKTSLLLPGEFELCEWAAAGLNVSTAVKKGIYTVHESLVIKAIGRLVDTDAK
jgi:mRNA interferase MazF